MKQIGKAQMEALLRRLLDISIMQDLVYFETVVWAEAKSLQPKGYFVLLVCKVKIVLVQLDEKGNVSTNVHPVEIPLLNVIAIDQLRDPAKFFPAEFARDTQHLRLSIDDQVAIDEIIDIYVIFVDSHVHCYLENAWIAVQMASAWPEMTSQSVCAFSHRLNAQESATLFRALREQFFVGPNQAESLENIAVVIGVNQFVKTSIFQAPEILTKTFNILLEGVTLYNSGYFESTIDVVDESTENIPKLTLYIAALIFYFQLLCGGVHFQDRLVLIDNTLHSVEEFVNAVLCLPSVSVSRNALAPLDQPPKLTRERSVTTKKDEVITLREQDFSPIQRKLIGIDNLQTAVLFLLQKLIEYGTHMNESSATLESGFLLRHLLESNEFCEKRIPRSFQAVVYLLRMPNKMSNGMFIFMHCFMLNWFCENSSRVRQIIRTKCSTEMQLLSGLLREKRSPNNHDSLFYKKGKGLLQMVLDSILTDTDST